MTTPPHANPNSFLGSGWLPLAHLLRPQGRRGELLADPLSDLADLFVADLAVVLVPSGASTPPGNAPPIFLRLEEHWFPTGKNAGRIVLKLSGCDSISQAESIAGKDLLIATTALPQLDPGTYFVGDLIGCLLLDSTDPAGPTPVGTIVDLEFATAPDGRTRLEDAAPLLAIAPLNASHIESQEPALIPFVAAWLDSVDIAAKQVIMHLPKGLFDPSDDLDPTAS